jgi:hypothetical protein
MNALYNLLFQYSDSKEKLSLLELHHLKRIEPGVQDLLTDISDYIDFASTSNMN